MNQKTTIYKIEWCFEKFSEFLEKVFTTLYFGNISKYLKPIYLFF